MHAAVPSDPPLPALASEDCALCRKPPPLCICAETTPIDNHVALLILQHPQEQDKTLGTARLLAHHCRKATLNVGLSWPSLAKALGRPADPDRWAILYLGSAKAPPSQEVVVLDSKGSPSGNQSLAGIEGIVLLDGTWSQAKALWWRNPWVLKCRRIILGPRQASRYGRVRAEPRQDSLSTIEAAGLLLSRLESRPEIEEQLTASFQLMLDRYRQAKITAPKRDWRRRPSGKPPRKAKR
ncbi:MAG TPA: DTW domain-containing protein [Rhodospirillaceae bacterium]|nr:DTW domain-containing protein [Rhodospirillaceae bacterium]